MGDLMGRKNQFKLGVAGVAVMFFGGWLLWYFAIRPHHPSSYSLFQIAILPTALFVIGIFCLLAAVGAFTDTRLRAAL
jgi:drug/metabolite transporter (DMT)-like permease